MPVTPGGKSAVVLAYAAAAVVTCALTPLARWLALRSGAVDIPDQRKAHERPVPTLGGIAIILGFLVAAWVGGAFLYLRPHVSGAILGGALLVATVGFIDDRKEITAKVKLGLQIVATGPLLLGGVTINFLSDPFHQTMIALPGWLAAALTVIWVVGVTNAINLIDGLDGLAAGVSAIACVALATVAITWQQPAAALLCAAVAGASAGFLPWNWHPAKVYMGDTGAYFLGYMIAATTIVGAFKVAAAISVLVPILVLAVPLLDTLLSPVRRYLRGRSAFAPDREHLHHRLVALGISEPRVVLLTYIVTGVCGAIAIWISRRG